MPLINVTGGAKGTQYSMTLQLLALMTTLTLLPSIVLMMTSFVRIIIVLSILRQALGTGQTPPNLVLVGLAIFLSFFIMAPVLQDIHANALLPYLQNDLSFDKALVAAEAPLRKFMLLQTREEDIALFMQMSKQGVPATPEAVPFTTLVPAFITSELKSAFTIGFSDLHPVCRDRPDCGQRVDVHGHDDVVAHDDFDAFQTHVVCAG